MTKRMRDGPRMWPIRGMELPVLEGPVNGEALRLVYVSLDTETKTISGYRFGGIRELFLGENL